MTWEAQVFGDLQAAAQQGVPDEVVATFWRQAYHTEVRKILCCHTNLADRPGAQFEINSRELVEMEATGWEMTALAHSHPGGSGIPSPTDITQLKRLPKDVRAFIWARTVTGWRLYEYNRKGMSWTVNPADVTLG